MLLIDKIYLSLLGLFALTACMPVSPSPFVGPNGKTAYSMRCSGFGRTIQECYQKAGEVCPAGYTIVDNSSGTVAVMNQGMMVASQKRDLVIECK
jgi:hypothetical protein